MAPRAILAPGLTLTSEATNIPMAYLRKQRDQNVRHGLATPAGLGAGAAHWIQGGGADTATQLLQHH